MINNKNNNNRRAEYSDSVPTFFARVALVTRFTGAGAVATVTLHSVLLDTVTLVRAARSEGPLRTSCRRREEDIETKKT